MQLFPFELINDCHTPAIRARPAPKFVDAFISVAAGSDWGTKHNSRVDRQDTAHLPHRGPIAALPRVPGRLGRTDVRLLMASNGAGFGGLAPMNDDEYQRLEKLTDRELFDFMTETDASQRMWVARHLLELRRNRTMDNMAEDVADCVAHFTIISVEASSNAKTQRSKEWADIEARYRVSATNAIALLRATMTGKPEKFMRTP